MIKIRTYFICLSILFSLNACQSLETLSIDYLVPAEISFPSNLKRIAVVNNTSAVPDSNIINVPQKKEPLLVNELKKSTTYFWGDAAIATESLANGLAGANYFNEVVICDSALRANDVILRENTLSKSEVEELCRKLDVDLLISLENLQIKAVRTVKFMPDWNVFLATTDARVFTNVKAYLPKRSGAMASLVLNDSIFWEEGASTETSAMAQLIKDEELIRQTSDFGGTIPVNKLTPSWKTSQRFYYSNGSVNMRDAAVYVREQEWEKAFELWQKEYQQSKSKKVKMRTALNSALYYEMQDSIPQAVEWATIAQNLADEVEKATTKMKEKKSIYTFPNYFSISVYLSDLSERMSNIAKLNMQMDRFKDDF